MSVSSPEQQHQEALCKSLAGPFRDIRSGDHAVDLPVIISILIIVTATAAIRFLVLGVCVIRVKEPTAPERRQSGHQYELLSVEGSDTPPPSYSESQSSSSASAQVPEEIATTAVTAAASSPSSLKPSQINDTDNLEEIGDTNPPLSTRTPENYTILTVCTVLIIVNLTALIVTWFGSQNFVYCRPFQGSKFTIITAVAIWTVYAYCVAWASSGIWCWWLVAKDLWYGQAQPGPRQNGDENGRTLMAVIILFWATLTPMLLAATILLVLITVPFALCQACIRGERQPSATTSLFSRLQQRRSELLEAGDTPEIA